MAVLAVKLRQRKRKPDFQTRDGSIQLYCGDCLEIMPLLGKGSVDAVVTDPPYGHNNNNNGDLIHRLEVAMGRTKTITDPRPIVNDGPEANEIVRKAMAEWARIIKPGGCCCCCCGGGGGPDPQFARWSMWMNEVLDFKQMIVWDKGSMGLGWHYRRSYETVLVGQKGGAKCAWYDKTRRIENIIRPGQYGIKKIIPSKSDHPTPKPVKLAEHFIGLHTKSGDVVLDSFMGAGWAGVACVNTRRKFIGIEIDKGHFDISVQRIEKALKARAEQFPLVVEA